VIVVMIMMEVRKVGKCKKVKRGGNLVDALINNR
jgi:hypothetical protein